jgi:hypothetical protein
MRLSRIKLELAAADRGYTGQTISAALHRHPTSWSQLLDRAGRNCRVHTLTAARIASTLGVPLESLLADESQTDN